jgi:hypothetical protein
MKSLENGLYKDEVVHVMDDLHARIMDVVRNMR